MHFKIETITPAKAEKMLATNYENQRHIKPSKLRTYAEMMANGEWNGMNGDTLKFIKNGSGEILVDGQHRLMAVVKSGTSQKMAVLRNVDKDAFKTIDQGDPRSVENFYQIAGVKHSKVASQVGKWLYYQEHGKYGHPLQWGGGSVGAVPVAGLVAEYSMKKYPDLPDVIDSLGDIPSQFQKRGLGTKTHMAYCYYLWQKEDPVSASLVVQFLATGEGSVPQTIRALREYLMQFAAKRKEQGIPGTVVGSIIINAMNTGWIAIHSGKKNVKAFNRLVAPFDKAMLKRGSVSGNVSRELTLINVH